MPIKIKQLPKTERPYEKLEKNGEDKLSDGELLAIIIKTGTKGANSLEIANQLLSKAGSIKGIGNISLEELKEIKGIGKVKAIQLKAVGEIAIRMFKTSNYKKVTIINPADLANILMSELRYKTEEIVKIVILNNKNEILKIQDIAMGGVNFANITMREILSEPIKMKAPKIILVHNHPSRRSNTK